MFKSLQLTAKENNTFRLHLVYSFIEGIIEGVLALNEFILVKSLHGSNYQIGFLFQFSVIVLIFSFIFNEVLKRIANKKKLIRIVGILTRLPLIILFFFPRSLETGGAVNIYHYLFLMIFLIYFLARPLIFPTINLFLKNNYQHRNFGKLYSYATSLNKIIMLITTFLFGLILDTDHFAFTYIYPAIAVLGILSIIILSKIEYQNPKGQVFNKNLSEAINDSFKNMLNILKFNKPYRDFEIGFMLYGFAWMSTAAVIVIFFDKVLELNYSSVAFYKNGYNIIAIVLLPYFGKLLGKIDPRKFAVITFSSLLVYIFFMGLTQYYKSVIIIWDFKIYYSLIFSFIGYGIFAATMALLWSIGSAYFCKDQDAGSYQSVHLSLTGLRSIVAPLIGVYFLEKIGYTGTFGLAILSLSIAIILMLFSMHRKYKTTKAGN
ncbi:MAG: MFS transporter [Chlorobi bacterium]|nr:MFS transporter [Chlorobiota bacterium]